MDTPRSVSEVTFNTECPVEKHGSFPIYHVNMKTQADTPGMFTYEVFDKDLKQSETTIDYNELGWEADDPRVSAINLLIHITCSPEIIAVAINRAASWYGAPIKLKSCSIAGILKCGLPDDAFREYTSTTNMYTQHLFTNNFFKEVGLILTNHHNFLTLLDSLAGKGEPLYKGARNLQIANLGKVIRLRGNMAGIVSRIHSYIPDLNRGAIKRLLSSDLNEVNPALGRAYDTLITQSVAIAEDIVQILNSEGFGGAKSIDPDAIQRIVNSELEEELSLLFDNYLYPISGLFHDKGLEFSEHDDTHRFKLPNGRYSPEISGHGRRTILIDGVAYPFRRSVVSCILPLLVASRR